MKKLELTWFNKTKRSKIEPRILLEDKDLSCHASASYGDDDIFDNKLIFGDNLLALKSLEQKYSGKIIKVLLLLIPHSRSMPRS